MKGGFNKVFRNFAAMKGKTEFDKRLIKGTYGHDSKEPKEKTYLMACLKGAHSEISASQALMKILQRFIENTENWSVNIKDYDLSEPVAHELSEKADILTHYKKKPSDNTYDSKMALLLSQLYCAYLKFIVKFMDKSKVLSVRITDVTKQVKKMKTKELFSHYESFDSLISQIVQMFENNDYCRKTRLFQNFVYMLFLDLVKIYNVFYIMTMETLDRYRKMSAAEMSKATVMYKNFCNFTETLKKEANTIPMLFGFTFKEPNYYKPDPKKERAMASALKDKESGRDGFGDDDDGSVGGEAVPEFEDVRQKYDEDEKESDDENSDEDYQFDLLSDIKKQEEMASVHNAPRRGKTTVQKKEKIKIYLAQNKIEIANFIYKKILGAPEPIQRGETVKVSRIEVEVEEEEEAEAEAEEWDPFGHKEENIYNNQVQVEVPVASSKKAPTASANIFGDDEDMWGGNAQTSTKPQTLKEQRQVLDDILGGDSIDFGAPQDKPRSQTMFAPKNDFDMLKNLYNTSSVAPNQPMYNNQSDYYNTGMAGGTGYGGMDYSGAGYNQSYGGGVGYGAQPQYYNTGYGAYGGATGYGGVGAATGYGGAGAATGYGGAGASAATGFGGAGAATGYGGYATGSYGASAGYSGGYNMTTGYGQQPGFSTTAPKSSTNNKTGFDPFS